MDGDTGASSLDFDDEGYDAEDEDEAEDEESEAEEVSGKREVWVWNHGKRMRY